MSDEVATYTLHIAMHGRLQRGGYMYGYEIQRNGAPVGAMSVVRETRSAPEKRIYKLGEAEYETKEEFKAACEAAVAAREAEASGPAQ